MVQPAHIQDPISTLPPHLRAHRAHERPSLRAEFGVSDGEVSVIPFGINNTIADHEHDGRSGETSVWAYGTERERPSFSARSAPYKGLHDLISMRCRFSGEAGYTGSAHHSREGQARPSTSIGRAFSAPIQDGGLANRYAADRVHPGLGSGSSISRPPMSSSCRIPTSFRAASLFWHTALVCP